MKNQPVNKIITLVLQYLKKKKKTKKEKRILNNLRKKYLKITMICISVNVLYIRDVCLTHIPNIPSCSFFYLL